jgi:hypothetical protein
MSVNPREFLKAPDTISSDNIDRRRKLLLDEPRKQPLLTNLLWYFSDKSFEETAIAYELITSGRYLQLLKFEELFNELSVEADKAAPTPSLRSVVDLDSPDDEDDDTRSNTTSTAPPTTSTFVTSLHLADPSISDTAPVLKLSDKLKNLIL